MSFPETVMKKTQTHPMLSTTEDQVVSQIAYEE